MSIPLRNTIIAFLVGMGVLIYIVVFLDAAFGLWQLDNPAVSQFAMTIGASVSAFIGGWLGIHTLRRQAKKGQPSVEPPAPRVYSKLEYLQYGIIVVYLITLVIGTFYYIFKPSSPDFIQSLFTNATGLMLGALAVVLGPVEE